MTATKSRSSSPGLEGRHDLFLRVEDDRRCLHYLVFGVHRGNLDHRPAEIALEQLQSARFGKGLRQLAQDIVVTAGLRRGSPGEPALVDPGFLAVAIESWPGHGLHVVVQQAGIEQFPHQVTHAARLRGTG